MISAGYSRPRYRHGCRRRSRSLPHCKISDTVINAKDVLRLIGPAVEAYRRRVRNLPETIRRAPEVARKAIGTALGRSSSSRVTAIWSQDGAGTPAPSRVRRPASRRGSGAALHPGGIFCLAVDERGRRRTVARGTAEPRCPARWREQGLQHASRRSAARPQSGATAAFCVAS